MAALDGLSLKELKQLITTAGLRTDDCIDKADLLARAQEAVEASKYSDVTSKHTPGTCDPTGTGMMVVDCLEPFSQSMTDPFLLLHAFGPFPVSSMPKFGMHPHRGFNEVPYLKRGRWLATDPWNMEAEGEDAKFLEGQLQWGTAGSGIEHGMKFDETYDGPVQGFQLWINLKGEDKLKPPIFQNARSEALPVLTPAPNVKAKLLVGELHGEASPVERQGIDCLYVDYMLEPGGEATHPRKPTLTALFVYVYEGAGSFGSKKPVVAKQGEVMSFSDAGDVCIRADQDSALGCLLIAGAPLKEPIVQHGPFVMSDRRQIMQAFQDYQSGNFLHPNCTYKLHTKDGTTVTKRGMDATYRGNR